MEISFINNVEEKFKKDVKYINEDIIAKQPNGHYVKWCKPLRAVSLVNITKNVYKYYWTRQYVLYPKYAEKIGKVCDEKFKNGLIPTEKMLEMVKNSKDNTTDKEDAIMYLTAEKKPKKKVGV